MYLRVPEPREDQTDEGSMMFLWVFIAVCLLLIGTCVAWFFIAKSRRKKRPIILSTENDPRSQTHESSDSDSSNDGLKPAIPTGNSVYSVTHLIQAQRSNSEILTVNSASGLAPINEHQKKKKTIAIPASGSQTTFPTINMAATDRTLAPLPTENPDAPAIPSAPSVLSMAAYDDAVTMPVSKPKKKTDNRE